MRMLEIRGKYPKYGMYITEEDDIEESKKSLAIELQKSLKWMSEMDINAFMKICDFMEFDD